MSQKIRIGVFGVGRGAYLARCFMLSDAEIVALCDSHPARLAKAAAKLPGAALYESFDEFIEHDGMDAVILANYFHEHTPYAIRCLEKGIHVFSECIANGTMAEGVALIRAAEKSSAIYMLAENYPFMRFNQEIRRVCDTGTLGRILYAEGEYNHPTSPFDTSFQKEYVYSTEHWRNYLPRSYYVTHSLAPIMYASGATPKRVTAMAVFDDTRADDIPTARHCADRATVMMTQNDDGSIFRFTGCAGFGGHHNAYRVCGVNGSIENFRGTSGRMMLRYNDWARPEGIEEINEYTAVWNKSPELKELIEKTGHGGGDFLVCREFLDCIEEGRRPSHPFDVHSAVTMASVAILAHRSMLEGSRPYDIPDFHSEADRKLYENDHLTPFPGPNGEAPTIPCCSVTDFAPTERQVEAFKKLIAD